MSRLLGTETEYAIRFSPEPGVAHPGNQALFRAIQAAVGRLVATRPGQGPADSLRQRVFTENGGSLYYERVPDAEDRGLLEAQTPECGSAAELLRYQRAQDDLLAEAARLARDDLAERGIMGELALIKNCRDAAGNVYGAQESYEVVLASGAWRLAWWLVVAGTLPLALGSALLLWSTLAALVAALIVVGMGEIALAILQAVRGVSAGEAATARERRWARAETFVVGRGRGWWAAVVDLPMVVLGAGIEVVAFRPYRRAMLPFLVSRCVLTGAGTLLDDGSFALSEKALDIRTITRRHVSSADRGVLEVGHLVKPFHSMAFGQLRDVRTLFRRRQRLQLGLSDANLCDVAELVKVGTTLAVLDLVERGALADAPQLVDPIAALHTIARDPTLRATVPLRDGRALTALELQRYYQRRAAEVLRDDRTVSLVARELVGRWGELLDHLEADPSGLFGRLDWVTKERLLDEAADLDAAARKKIDLRYHELGEGYHARLQAAGLSPRLVTDEEVQRARTEPPGDTPAHDRGRLVRALAAEGVDARVGWDDVRVKGKVIPLRRRATRAEGDGGTTGGA